MHTLHTFMYIVLFRLFTYNINFINSRITVIYQLSLWIVYKKIKIIQTRQYVIK